MVPHSYRHCVGVHPGVALEDFEARWRCSSRPKASPATSSARISEACSASPQKCTRRSTRTLVENRAGNAECDFYKIWTTA
eukprot:1250649-Amphidinium_carterae.1